MADKPLLNFYVAHKDFVNELETETGLKSKRGLIPAKKGALPSIWAQDEWYNVKTTTLENLKANPKLLIDLTPDWHFYKGSPPEYKKVIAKILPLKPDSRLTFKKSELKKNFGVIAIMDLNTIYYTPHTREISPLGIYEFNENKTEPPSRAYLKLWEILTRLNRFPKPDETCVDLGASPGGWSFVLADLCQNVKAIDRAPLSPPIAKHPHISFVQGSAFGFQPREQNPVDWIFSDVICYPQKLYTFASRWLDSGKVKNMICTVKLQGKETDEAVELFKKIPHSKLYHLYHNKHELTWVYLG